MIAPLLLFSVGIDSRISNTVLDEWALDGAYVCVTPTTSTPQESETKVSINIIHYGGDEATVVSSPRIHPGIVYHSLLMSCCQLVMSLCDCPPNNQISGAVVPVMRCGMDHVMLSVCVCTCVCTCVCVYVCVHVCVSVCDEWLSPNQ